MAVTVAVVWTDPKMKVLLTIWDSELVQKLLAKATRNKHIYEILSKELTIEDVLPDVAAISSLPGLFCFVLSYSSIVHNIIE